MLNSIIWWKTISRVDRRLEITLHADRQAAEAERRFLQDAHGLHASVALFPVRAARVVEKTR